MSCICMIEIIPTKTLQRVLPLGLLNTKDPLLICKRDEHGRLAITEFTAYCNQLPTRETTPVEQEGRDIMSLR